MKTYFEDIFKYQNNVNQYIIQELIDLKIDIPETIQLLISHSLNAQQVWNARILGEKEIGVFDVHSFQDCLEIDSKNLKRSMNIIENIDLDKKVYYLSTSGIKYQNTVKEIFSQINQHYSYHRGQVISKLINVNIVLKPTDFIYWRRKQINS